MFNFPDVTGSVGTKAAPAPEAGAAKSNQAAAQGSATGAGRNAGRSRSDRPSSGRTRHPRTAGGAAHRARCARQRELDMRENLLKAAEKRLEERDRRAQGARGARQRRRADQGRKRSGPLQEPRHHVREHEGQGRRQDLRSARPQGAGGCFDPDQSAPHVRHPGADVAGSRRAAHRRARRSRKDKATPAELPKIEGQPTAN